MLSTRLMKDYMKEHKLSIIKFSRKAKINHEWFLEWQKNPEKNPDYVALFKVARLMNCSIADFFEGERFPAWDGLEMNDELIKERKLLRAKERARIRDNIRKFIKRRALEQANQAK